MNATCFFCGCTMPLGEAIEGWWIPSFYDGDEEITEPVCPTCQEAYLTLGEDDEWEFSKTPAAHPE